MMILTHKDDVADHKRWKERFPHLIRVIQRFLIQQHSHTHTQLNNEVALATRR